MQQCRVAMLVKVPLRSYEATKAAAKKPTEQYREASTGFEPVTSAMLSYRLSYEASLESGQRRVQFIQVYI